MTDRIACGWPCPANRRHRRDRPGLRAGARGPRRRRTASTRAVGCRRLRRGRGRDGRREYADVLGPDRVPGPATSSRLASRAAFQRLFPGPARGRGQPAGSWIVTPGVRPDACGVAHPTRVHAATFDHRRPRCRGRRRIHGFCMSPAAGWWRTSPAPGRPPTSGWTGRPGPRRCSRPSATSGRCPRSTLERTLNMGVGFVAILLKPAVARRSHQGVARHTGLGVG